MTETNNRIEWLDSLRALAIIAVIIIHISSPIVNVTFGESMNFWWIGHIVDSAVRFAVPLFLMISGATLLTRKYNLKEYYKRRFMRVVLPFLFFMLVYWVFRWINLPANQQPHDFNSIIDWGIRLFLEEGISKHLWFVYMLVFLYLIIPFVGEFVRKLKSEMIIFLLAAWVLLCLISHNFSVNIYLWSGGNILQKLYIYVLYLGYMLLGYYLYNIFYVSRNVRLTAVIVYVITVAVTVLVVFYTSHVKSKLDLSLYSYLNLNTIIQSAAVFIALKNTSINQNWLKKLTFTISDYSYGIYLVHILVIGVFFNNGIFWTMAHPLISLPVLLVLTLSASFAIIFILRKIPFGKYISG